MGHWSAMEMRTWGPGTGATPPSALPTLHSCVLCKQPQDRAPPHLRLSAPIAWAGLSSSEGYGRELRALVSTLQNPVQFADSDRDSSEGDCSDATVRTSKNYSSATW